MIRRIILAPAVLYMLVYYLTGAAAAQTVLVKSLVNGEPVTTLDLEERLKFLSFSTGQDITGLNRLQFERDALQILIDEKLKIQAAKQIDPSILSTARANARQLVDQTYGTNGQTASQRLRENNVSFQVALDKATSDLAWVTVLQRTFPRQFNAIQKQATDELKRLENSLSEPQVRLLEIVLLPSADRPLDATLELATQIVEAVKNGTDFRGIAQQYSVSSSAQKGGDIGWAQIQRLPASFVKPLETAAIGDVLEPIELDGIVYILSKQGFRPQGLLDASRSTITTARAVLPVSDPSSAEIIEQTGRELLSRTQNATSCDEIQQLNAEFGSGAESLLSGLSLDELAPQLAALIAPLEVGDKTEPILFAEGFSVIMLCEKSDPEVSLPPLAELERIELDKLFSVLSSRYLIRLRRSAVIETRN